MVQVLQNFFITSWVKYDIFRKRDNLKWQKPNMYIPQHSIFKMRPDVCFLLLSKQQNPLKRKSINTHTYTQWL